MDRALAIYKQPGSRFWWVSVYRGAELPRLRVSTETEDEDQARAIEATLKRGMKGGASRDRLVAVLDQLMGASEPSLRVSLQEAWKIYQALPSVTLGKAMASIRRGHLRAFLRWVGGRFPRVAYMDQVTRDIAVQYGEHLDASTNTGTTYNHHRADLHAVWGALLHRAGLPENVWDVVPRAKASQDHGRAFTREEEAAILAACEGVDMPGNWYGACLVARECDCLREGSFAVEQGAQFGILGVEDGEAIGRRQVAQVVEGLQRLAFGAQGGQLGHEVVVFHGVEAADDARPVGEEALPLAAEIVPGELFAIEARGAESGGGTGFVRGGIHGHDVRQRRQRLLRPAPGGPEVADSRPVGTEGRGEGLGAEEGLRFVLSLSLDHQYCFCHGHLPYATVML